MIVISVVDDNYYAHDFLVHLLIKAVCSAIHAHSSELIYLLIFIIVNLQGVPE